MHETQRQRDASPSRRAFAGLRVLDLGQIYNGSYAGLLLALHGADVIKVEPPTGDLLRGRREAESHEFAMVNANKRGVALDLRSEQGRSILLDLVEVSDVLLENFRAGTLDRLGVGYEVLRDRNPQLVYAAGTGYGESGPYRDRAAMDLTVQAMSGFIASTGFPDGDPVKTGPAVADFLGGIHLYAGIVTALFDRERTGMGQRVEVSMHDAAYPTLASLLGAMYAPDRVTPGRTGNRHSGLAAAPYNVYPTLDGNVAVACMSQGQWERLAVAMGDPETGHDERFSDTPQRADHIDLVDQIVAGWFSTWTQADLCVALERAGVPHAPVLEVHEVATDAHLVERGMVRLEAGAEGQLRPFPRSPMRLAGHGRPDFLPPPALGEHSQQVLNEVLGVPQTELRRLLSIGVIRGSQVDRSEQ